ncbi:hypothetical protein [Azospirillum soli]|uniref:hypothetical protein n=1 Tax=Azospirillum soli TaxID=1304799 RepID=UPI001AE57366|nr:hypothetical protein [Azospirillum soli]MBP2313771.1 hypothetical protein [Azospirillum soli]
MHALPGVLAVLFGIIAVTAAGPADAHGARDRGSWRGGAAVIVPPGSTVIIVPRPRPVPPPVIVGPQVWAPSWQRRPPPTFVPPVFGWPHDGPVYSSPFDNRYVGNSWGSRHRW